MTTNNVRFDSPVTQSLPSNLDAEECVLGAVLFFPETIAAICHRLPVQAFLLDSHRIIYQSCLTLNRKGNLVNLITVADHLKSTNKLKTIGGKSKLAQLVSSSVTNESTLDLVDLLNRKHVRRQLIQLGNEITHLAYESIDDCSDLLSHIEQKTTEITKSPLNKGKVEFDMTQYHNLINRVQEIERKTPDPGFRLFRMQNLSRETKRATKELEQIYYKSLVAGENDEMTDWEAINDLFGKDTREWLMNGFLPKGKVILLHAKGGVGKTRLAYEFAYHLGTGQPWNGFPVNGRYKILIIQTDESPNDMLRVLQDRGFGPHMDIRFKTRWTVDHLQALLTDMESWRPDFVIIDSLASASRNSIFSENEVEYARPVLKLKDIAQQTGATILLIHHSSAQGTARGSTAIFNSVSEVWKLEPDNSQSNDGLERLLKIEKSRSRAPATYRLRFNPEDKSWLCLGKESEEPSGSSVTVKDRIVEFLGMRRGVAFQIEEIRNGISGSSDSIRRSAFQLAEDGVIYRKDALGVKGRPLSYYLPKYKSDHQRPESPTNDDRNHNPDLPTVSGYSGNDPKIVIGSDDHQFSGQPCGLQASAIIDTPETENIFSDSAKKITQNENTRSSSAETVVNQGNLTDHTQKSDFSTEITTLEVGSHSAETVVNQRNISDHPLQKPSYVITIDSQLGEWSVRLTQDRSFKTTATSRVILDFKTPDGVAFSQKKIKVKNRHQAEEFARNQIPAMTQKMAAAGWCKYEVAQVVGTELDPEVIWVSECKLVELPSPPLKGWYVFETPAGDRIQVAALDEFKRH